MLKVQSKQDNVIFLSRQPSYDPADVAFKISDERLYKDCLDVMSEIEYDPAEAIADEMVLHNLNVYSTDLAKALALFDRTMENRCDVFECIPLRQCLVRMSVTTRVGNSNIIHNPVQCSDIQFCSTGVHLVLDE